MSSSLRIVVATVTVASCVAVLVWHQGRRKRPDFFTSVVACYGLVFGLLPLLLPWVLTFDVGLWEWMRHIPIDSRSYAIGLILASLSLLSFVGAYCAFSVRAVRSGTLAFDSGVLRGVRVVPETRHLAMASGLLATGGLALLGYIVSIGGVMPFLVEGLLYRSGENPSGSNWLFLKTLAQLVVPASYMWYARCYSTMSRRLVNRLFALVSFLLATALMFHLGGRMQFIAYLAAYPAVLLYARGRLTWKHLALVGVVGLLFVLFGHEVFLAASNPAALGERMSDVGESPGKAVADILIEFSFPSLALARVVDLYGGGDGLRYFIDFPIAIFNLLPKSLLNIQEMITLTEVVSASLEAPIPADIVSLGFSSGGLVGVVAVGAIFGAAVAWFDRVFFWEATAIEVALKYGLMGIVGLRVMYGDPFHLAAGHFGMLVGLVLYLMYSVRAALISLGANQSFRIGSRAGLRGSVAESRDGRSA